MLRKVQPGPQLLAWQIYFLAFSLGLLALRHPPAALCGLALLLLLARDRLGTMARMSTAVLACILGWATALALAPGEPPPTPEWMHGRRALPVRATVESCTGMPDHRLRIVLRDVQVQPGEDIRVDLAGGLVWTWANPTLRPVAGQRITARLRIKPIRNFSNPHGYDGEWRWALQDVFFRSFSKEDKPRATLLGEPTFPAGMRERLRSGLERHLAARSGPGHPTSGAPSLSDGQALLMAMLFGDRFHLRQDTVDSLAKAGLAHSLALSGLHVGFVVALGCALALGISHSAARLWPALHLYIPRGKLAVLIALPLVAAYVWLGQATPSLVRAAIMFAGWGWLLMRGKERVLLDGLFLALVCIIAFNPLSIYDIRLQLSALAVGGIVFFFHLFLHGATSGAAHGGTGSTLTAAQRRLRPPGPVRRTLERLGRTVWGRVLSLLLAWFAASLCTLPLILDAFGRVQTNPLCNILWLPILGLALMPLALTGLITWVAAPGAPVGGTLLHLAATLGDGALPWLQTFADPADPAPAMLLPHWAAMAGFWGLLSCGAVVCFTGSRRSVHLAAAFSLGLLIVPTILSGLDQFRDDLAVQIVDIGQGQSIALELPGGRRMLVDGGGMRFSGFDVGEAILGPFLTRNSPPRLDWVLLSHRHSDHLNGLVHILESFDVAHRGCTAQALQPTGWVHDEDWNDTLARPGWRALTAGDTVTLGSDVYMDILHPPRDFPSADENELSLSVRIVWDDTPMALLPGDAEEDALRSMLASGRPLQSKLLVLPHHGSKTGIIPDFYEKVQPEVAVASAGFMNPWKLPADAMRQLLQEMQIPLYDTARHGYIRVAWDSPESRGIVHTAITPRAAGAP